MSAVSAPVFASTPVLTDAAVSSAVDLPVQPDEAGLADILFELRAERGNSTLLVLTHFPQGLGLKTDAALALLGWGLHNAAFAEVQEQSDYMVSNYVIAASEAAAAGKTALPARLERSWGNTFAASTTWTVFKPSKAFASVLFREDRSGGGAHGNWSYHTVSFDLESGRELTLKDVFPAVENVQALLGARVLARLQSRLDLANKEQPFAQEGLDLAMERLVLTPEGLRVMFAPYEIASYSEGEFIVDIPKEELLRIGAASGLWQ